MTGRGEVHDWTRGGAAHVARRDGGDRCPRCHGLLPPAAAVCGECGAGICSPEWRGATLAEAPHAWPLVSRPPAATASPHAGQYDRGMLTTPGTRPVGPPPATSARVGTRPSRPGAGERRDATPARRVLAVLLDLLLLSVATAPLAAALLWLARLGGGASAQLLIGLGSALLGGVALLLLWAQGERGRGPGAAALGLRLVRAEDERPVGTLAALRRGVLVLPLLPVAARDAWHGAVGRSPHDRAIGARLLDVRRGEDPWCPRPVLAPRGDPRTLLGAATTPVVVPRPRPAGHAPLTPHPRPVETVP